MDRVRLRHFRVKDVTKRRSARSLMWRLASGLGLLLALTMAAPAQETRCASADAAAGAAKAIPSLQQKLAQGHPLRIVALGSSSTEGTPNMQKSEVFPAVLQRELGQELPVPVEVFNKGRGGENVFKMTARLESDVIALRPDLLIWQLGVNDVLQMDGVESSIAEMRKTLGQLKSIGLPVVLVDLQISPSIDRDKDTPVMQAAIADAAASEGVMHFHRYDMMRSLVERSQVPMTELVERDGLHMTALAHFCTGTLLARQIARASLLRRANPSTLSAAR